MKVITEERLRELTNNLYGLSVQDLRRKLLANCDELNPWHPIELERLKDGRLVNIGKWTGVNFEWVHVAFLIGDEWHLPFDSERDENGTPVLNDNDNPTHYAELPEDLK